MLRYVATALLTVPLLFANACHTAPTTEVERERLMQHAADAIDAFRETDPTMQAFFDTAEGWAVFPAVGKGGAGVGGAYGKGVLYQNGQPIGFADLTQGTIGFQLGGQSYREIIFFADAIADFMAGEFAFSAQASAVAATAGASADADYQNGVAVFTMQRGGLMYEASIGGQKFNYVPR